MTMDSVKVAFVKKHYLDTRRKNPCHMFTELEIADIVKAYSIERMEITDDHPLIQNPSTTRESKPVVDDISLELWNEIMPYEFNITTLDDCKTAGDDFVEYMQGKYPNGEGMNESESVQFITAQSASSFMGIQVGKHSKLANESMRKTLIGHSTSTFKDREWLLPNLEFVSEHIRRHPNIMNRDYSDICMSAKYSSSSIPKEPKYRDYVLIHTMEDLLKAIELGVIPMLISLGTRNDRRGKYRLVCSFDARFRMVDYLLNNGSYELCEGTGLLSQYTTEGFNNSKMWDQLVKMADRTESKTMICLDYEGYDTQISMTEYLEISRLMNRYRKDDPVFAQLWSWYESWITQPKPLIKRDAENMVMVIELYQTLASGLHATHSSQNMIGIATLLEAQKRGITIYQFWANGDDQNTLIDSSDVSKYMEFIGETFKVSWPKSLIGHKFAVWGKLWFASDFHPTWEIGTFRSIWEEEGTGSTFVSESKLQSNYCKILQVAITMIRLGKTENTVRTWIEKLCSMCPTGVDTTIDPHRIPVTLNNLTSKTNVTKVSREPRGLNSVEYELRRRNFAFSGLVDSNWYDLLRNMYTNKTFYSLGVDTVHYHPRYTQFGFNRGLDYSKMVPGDVPWIFRDLYTGKDYTSEDQFSRDVLQSTKSYDGRSCSYYEYHDMFTLSHAINERNKDVWAGFTHYQNR